MRGGYGVFRRGIIVPAILATATSAPAAQLLYPLVSGWEQWFRIESQVSVRSGHPVVSGTVWNTSGWSAKRIQLLIEGLDAGGTPISQRVVWLGLDLPKGTHAYFEVPVAASAPAATSYRVSVFAFDQPRGRWG